MEKYIELEGTKEQIINQLVGQNQNIGSSNEITKKYIGLFLDIVGQNRDLLSDDEIFERRLSDYDGNTKLIITNAEYYISIKKITLELIALIAAFTTRIPIQNILHMLGIEAEGALVVKLDSIWGESCIMLEAARKKGKGINKNLFKKNNCECVNSYLPCKYNEDGKCTCDSNRVENICKKLEEKNILIKKGNSYFYLDII